MLGGLVVWWFVAVFWFLLLNLWLGSWFDAGLGF